MGDSHYPLLIAFTNLLHNSKFIEVNIQSIFSDILKLIWVGIRDKPLALSLLASKVYVYR